MSLVIPIALVASFYFIVLIVLFVAKNKQKPDSPKLQKYQNFLTVWILLGVAIFLITMMALGGGPIFFM